MFKKIQAFRLDHYAHHLAVTSLVVFLLVLNFTMFNYASAANGSVVDTKVNSVVNKTVKTYNSSSQYMFDYSVTWGELLLEWNDFIVDTYFIMHE
jgi:hypothetical protein